MNFINFTLANETFRGCFQAAKQMDKFDFGILAKAKTSKSGKSWEVLNVRVPGCDLLGSKRQKPIFVVEQILALLKKYNPRMPRRCPLKKVSFGYNGVLFFTWNYYLFFLEFLLLL